MVQPSKVVKLVLDDNGSYLARAKNYGDWAKKFYYGALQDGYTIKMALDKATQRTHNSINFFYQCQLYEGIGFHMKMFGGRPLELYAYLGRWIP